MGFEHPIDGQSFGFGRGENPIRRYCRGLAGRLLVIEDGIDDGGTLRRRVKDEVAHGIGGLVEEAADGRLLGGHGTVAG